MILDLTSQMLTSQIVNPSENPLKKQNKTKKHVFFLLLWRHENIIVTSKEMLLGRCWCKWKEEAHTYPLVPKSQESEALQWKSK